MNYLEPILMKRKEMELKKEKILEIYENIKDEVETEKKRLKNQIEIILSYHEIKNFPQKFNFLLNKVNDYFSEEKSIQNPELTIKDPKVQESNQISKI